jgi:hypothetical protein
VDDEAAIAGGGNEFRRGVRVGIDHRRGRRIEDFREEPELGRSIILEGRVVVEMVAGQVGEGPGGKPDAIEPRLGETVARSLERHMGHAFLGELRQHGVEVNRIGGGVGERPLAGGRDHSDGADAGGAEPHSLPDLAHKGGDRRLAVGAGHGDGDVGLHGVEPCRHQGEGAPGIVGDDHRNGDVHRHGMAACQHRDGTPGEGIGNEARAIDLGPRESGENITGMNRAAVGGQAGDGAGSQFRRQGIDDPVCEVAKRHAHVSGPSSEPSWRWRPFRASRAPRR